MHVVVTGASAGIGEALAREWGRAGAALTLVARRRDRLEALSAEIGTPCHVVARDLSEPTCCADWLPEAEAKLGPVDILVNNAGVQIIGPTWQTPAEAADRLLTLDLLVPLRLTRAALPGMVARGRGCIVDIASMAALAPTPGMTWYNAAKGGLAAASEALRGELAGTGVHVVTVYPGIIETEMGKAGLAAYETGLATRLQPRGSVDGLARLVRRAVERRSARVIYPRVYHLARWFPGTTRWVMDTFSPRVLPQLP